MAMEFYEAALEQWEDDKKGDCQDFRVKAGFVTPT